MRSVDLIINGLSGFVIIRGGKKPRDVVMILPINGHCILPRGSVCLIAHNLYQSLPPAKFFFKRQGRGTRNLKFEPPAPALYDTIIQYHTIICQPSRIRLQFIAYSRQH